MNMPKLLAVGAVAVVLAAGARADEKADLAKMLVGKWEVTKTHEGGPPMGAIVVFTKDGKITVTGKQDGKEEKMEGTYKVEAHKFILTFKVEDKEHTINVKVNKITDKEMSTENDEGKVVECKKKS